MRICESICMVNYEVVEYKLKDFMLLYIGFSDLINNMGRYAFVYNKIYTIHMIVTTKAFFNFPAPYSIPQIQSLYFCNLHFSLMFLGCD